MKKNQKNVIAELLQWIEENIHLPLHVNDIANRSGYSYFHIQKLFREYTGVTLARYVRQLKLQRAAEALEKTDAPIVEIALHFGFEGQQTFTRIFSRHFHTSPGKWRNQVKSFNIKATAESEKASSIKE